MNKEQQTLDLQSRLDSVDVVASEPMPAGWSRRNWVQREAIAFGAITADFIKPPRDPLPQ
jgi:hypothetical protein